MTTQDPINIDPCPFCGERGALLMREATRDKPGWAVVQCMVCQARGPIRIELPEYSDIEILTTVFRAAIVAWNSRK